MAWSKEERERRLFDALREMKETFERDPEAAVRSQAFIQIFHRFVADDLRSFITTKAARAGIRVVEEASIFGSFKSKDVDVAVIHPINGPLLLVGVRSQMSSVGNNVLTYYQDIVGEAISLQERFPMCTTGYAYLHPLVVNPFTKRNGKLVRAEAPNHSRYAQLYAAIGQRDDRLYKHMTGSYDQFAYCVVDFQNLTVRDDIVTRAVRDLDMSIFSLAPRLVETFHSRNLWLENIFDSTGREDVTNEDGGIPGLDDTLVTPQ